MTSQPERELIFYRLEASSALPEKLRANMPAIIWIAPGTIISHPSDNSTTVLQGFPVTPSNSRTTFLFLWTMMANRMLISTLQTQLKISCLNDIIQDCNPLSRCSFRSTTPDSPHGSKALHGFSVWEGQSKGDRFIFLLLLVEHYIDYSCPEVHVSS